MENEKNDNKHIEEKMPRKTPAAKRRVKKDKRAEEMRSDMEELRLRMGLMELKDKVAEELRNDLQGYKSELRRGRWYILLVAGAIVLFVVGIGYKDASKFLREQLNKVNARVSERLDAEFTSEKIQNLIASKAEEYSKNKSQEYIRERVEGQMIPFFQELEGKISEAEMKIESLDAKAQLYALSDSVRLGGTRKAYEKLVSLARSDSDIRDLAGDYLKVIKFELESYREAPTYTTLELTCVYEGKQVKLDEIPIKQIFNIIGYPTTTVGRKTILWGYLLKRPESELLAEALNVLSNSDALYSCLAANIVISSVTKEKGDITDFAYWKGICEQELRREKASGAVAKRIDELEKKPEEAHLQPQKFEEEEQLTAQELELRKILEEKNIEPIQISTVGSRRDGKDVIELKGVAMDPDALSHLIACLEESPFFDTVKLTSTMSLWGEIGNTTAKVRFVLYVNLPEEFLGSSESTKNRIDKLRAKLWKEESE